MLWQTIKRVQSPRRSVTFYRCRKIRFTTRRAEQVMTTPGVFEDYSKIGSTICPTDTVQNVTAIEITVTCQCTAGSGGTNPLKPSQRGSAPWDRAVMCILSGVGH